MQLDAREIFLALIGMCINILYETILTRSRKFAHNIGIKFATPEEFFRKEAPLPFEWDSVDVTKLLGNSMPLACNKLIFTLYSSATGDSEITEGGIESLTSSQQEMVLFVGFPASGKSTLAKRHMVPKGYVHVNRDTLKTQEKCLKVAREAIDQGKSVVVWTKGDIIPSD